MTEVDTELVGQKNRIVELSSALFFRYGYSKVTIDEIAAELHISKTTIYRFFASKEELLEDVIRNYYSQLQLLIKEITGAAKGNPLEQLKSVLRIVGEKLLPMEPRVVQDIRSSVPKIWQSIKELQDRFVLSAVETLLRKGVKAKLIRSDIDTSLMADLMVMMIKHAFQAESVKELSHSMQEISQAMIGILFQGIANPEGA